MLWLRNLLAYLVCAVAAVAGTRSIASTVLQELLIPNLLTVVVALLAINVQTTAVIAVKLREIADRSGAKFALSVRQFRVAIYEQAALVVLALGLSAIGKSPIAEAWPIALEIAAFFVLIAALHIFLDLTASLLVALFPEE